MKMFKMFKRKPRRGKVLIDMGDGRPPFWARTGDSLTLTHRLDMVGDGDAKGRINGTLYHTSRPIKILEVR